MLYFIDSYEQQCGTLQTVVVVTVFVKIPIILQIFPYLALGA